MRGAPSALSAPLRSRSAGGFALALAVACLSTSCAELTGQLTRGLPPSVRQRANASLNRANASLGKSADAVVRAAPRAMAAQLPVGEEEERAMGGAIAVMIVQRYGGLVADPALTRYVGLVGNAVASVSSRPLLKWHFGVLASDQVNAVSAPGGYVFVTRGALAKMRSEAELAGVLAHEVAHVTERHAVKILRNLKSANAVKSGVKSTLGAAGRAAFSKVIDGFLNDYLTKGLPKSTEFAADAVAVGLLARVGYATTGLRSFLTTMAAGAASKQAFYATHPDTSDRVRRLDTAIQRAGGAHGAAVAERFAKATEGRVQGAGAAAAPTASAAPKAADPKATVPTAPRAGPARPK